MSTRTRNLIDRIGQAIYSLDKEEVFRKAYEKLIANYDKVKESVLRGARVEETVESYAFNYLVEVVEEELRKKGIRITKRADEIIQEILYEDDNWFREFLRKYDDVLNRMKVSLMNMTIKNFFNEFEKRI